MSDSHTLIKEFITKFGYEVGYWDSTSLTCYERKKEPLYSPLYADGSLEPFEIQEYIEGSDIDLAWCELLEKLDTLEAPPILVALSDELKEQWIKEWG